MRSNKLKLESINTGSMADIAFLLLIFFLVSTTILQEKGLMLKLPPEVDDPTTIKIKDRNVFNIHVNSKNQYLIENEVRGDLSGLQSELINFILNESHSDHFAESPQDAVVSIKTDRGTDYKMFITLLDEVKESYYTIYGDRVGMSASAYRALDQSALEQRILYEKGKEGIPMNISIAEPDALAIK
ncbi:ExbD/TolR family protein [Reichenbachiella agariperforans]|uniref:ExbD/TolR family protein n=1 Tax=Reichenbachiella agariperforans TaxID=156994 RepID=UPI001C08187A|nr:biopolymer transporter ExbD [Reichenbachiella agariperforans]MBU2913333.1 biopolymer transporter ExbD [Reichenbachiella agariperforans]